MATCAYCETFILFGGKIDATGRYCNEKCQASGNLLAASRRIPEAEITRQINEIWRGSCPQCRGPGPVDVHKAHTVWSAIFLTSWKSELALSCQSCARKRQLGAIAFSTVFGWWGFPWGLGVTPMQIGKNIAELAAGPRADRPTLLLQKLVRIQAAAQALNEPKSSFPKARPPVITETVPAAATPNGDERYTPKGDERYMPKPAKV